MNDKPATARIYYDNKLVLTVVGYHDETTEQLLVRARNGIFVTVEGPHRVVSTASTPVNPIVNHADNLKIVGLLDHGLTEAADDLRRKRTTIIEHGGDPDAEYP
jgi:hypothetical protein